MTKSALLLLKKQGVLMASNIFCFARPLHSTRILARQTLLRTGKVTAAQMESFLAENNQLVLHCLCTAAKQASLMRRARLDKCFSAGEALRRYGTPAAEIPQSTAENIYPHRH